MGIRNKLANWLLGKEEKKRIITGVVDNNLETQPTWNNWSTNNAIKHGLKSSTYVYACIDRLMSAAASVPWNAYVRNAKGEWDEAHNHPLEQLIQQPNPFMSRKQLIEIITAHLYLGGNSLLQKIKVQGTTVELWPLQPDNIKPLPHKTDFVKGYKYEKGTDKKIFEPDEVAHFMFVDPSDMYWGMSPLMAGAKTVDTDVEAVKWNKVALQNRAVADGVFSFENALTQDQWEEARKQVKEQHQGADNARTPWVLGAGASWNQMSLSPVEMDFLNSRKMTVQEICSIFQVPPPMVGVYEDATLANIETSRRIFWLDTIIPFLDSIQEVLNRTLAPEFGEDVWLGYDISNVQALQENVGEKIENANKLFNMGVPFNKINKRLELGFDDLDGGNNGWLPMNLIPTSYKPDTPKPVQEDDDKAFKRLDQMAKKLEERKFFNLDDKEQKEIHWKRMDDRRRRWEDKVAGMVGKQFQKESSKVVSAFKKGGTNRALSEVDKQIKNWETLYRAFYTSIIEDFGDETLDSLGKTNNIVIEKKFDAYDEGVKKWIDLMVAKNVKFVSQTTRDRIKRETGIGFENGEDSQDIARRLQGLYESMSERRAMTIARTELGSAMNAGSHFAVEQTGLKYDRVWLASLDNRTRSSHEDMDGVTVEGDEPFELDGGEMMFPGDSSMGADEDEIIHCRCVETYEVRR